MPRSIGIIDEPVAPGATDNLDINIHSKSLIDFITDTSTPITVGIQGEWGSGKTSLINSIHHAFDSQDTIKQIWINSWEYSLLSTPEEALLKIVNRIIDDLLESDTNVGRKEVIKEGAGKIFRGALRVGAQVALGSEAAKVASELLDSSGQSISELRYQLTELVQDIAHRPSNPYTKIVVYVDDLDRIEPRNAVAILELLKNIFSVPNCVFILAIDYQVVVKGLEHKFGKQTPENEWEFRAFFDKIIQLPFMMPMGQYNIGKYVNSLLVGIGFVEEAGLDDEAIREIILRTIGGNPRSIKRLANSVSLIQIFVKNKKEMSKEENIVDGEEEGISSEDEKFLLFALLCLQIAYPPIYSLLVKEPDFPKWDDDLALKETNRSEERSGSNDLLGFEESKKIFETDFEAAKKSDDFNEEWEQALYRICYSRPRVKPRVNDISKFFSYIKDVLLSDQQEIIGETISRLLTQTSVTSVTSTDQGQQQPTEKFARTYYSDIDAWIKTAQSDGHAVEFLDLTRNTLAIFQELDVHDMEFKFSKTGGMTIYVNKRKCFAQGMNGKKGPTTLMFLRDFEKNYGRPSADGLTTRNIRLGLKRDNSAWDWGAEFYLVSFNSVQQFESKMQIIRDLIHRTVALALKHKSEILTVRYKKASLKNLDIETINYLNSLYEEQNTYPLD